MNTTAPRATVATPASSACYWKHRNGHGYGGGWETQCGGWYDAIDFGCSPILKCPKCGRETTTVEPIKPMNIKEQLETAIDATSACSAATSAALYRLLEYHRNLMPFCVGMSEKEYAETQEAKNADAVLAAYREETGAKASAKPS